VLELRSVTRQFGETVAVNEVSFAVRSGSLTGFVGANGAGKTTTMRIIMGVLGANAGEVLWHGHPVTSEDRRRFGYMPEERGLYPKQRIADQLAYLGRLHGMSARAASGETMALLERFGLADRAKDKVESLSLGNQQRVQIAAALLSSPDLLVLDEPFSGLDPDAVLHMTDLLREHATQGAPVLFSSHQLDIVERICDDLVILSQGRVVASGTIPTLRSRGSIRHRLVLDRDAGWVRDQVGVHVVDVDGPQALVELLEPGAEHAVLTEALRRGTVLEFARVVPSLADVYQEVTAR
jgi:ABC-2 type transport system ATP-binding protein